MKLLYFTSIFYVFLRSILALFIFSNEDSIKEYTVANTQINNLESKDTYIFNVNMASKTYKIVIKPDFVRHLFDESSEVILYSKNLTLKRNLSEYASYVVNGYIDGISTSSSAEGYLHDGKYYGTLVFGNKSYYVANINRFPKIAILYKNKVELNAVIYDQDSILPKNQTNLFRRSVPVAYSNKSSIENEINPEVLYREFIAERHICNLFLLLDNSFITIIHSNDVTAAVAQVMISMREVNSLYRSTDFDGDGIPDNIGFIIKYLVVLETEESPYNYIPLYSSQPANPKEYIAHFAQYAILEQVCLGVVLTAQSFKENVLGVSYSAVSESDRSNDVIGGICQRPFARTMLSLNAVAVSYISTHGVHLTQNTLDTCLAHELGHAFGCRHDLVSDPGYQEDYLMSSYTLPGVTAHNFQFSPISKKHLMMTVPKKGLCLMNSKEAFCGNGIVENGEECDCGTKYTCKSKDPCCIPSGTVGACQVNRASGFQCHPSQGLCCTSKCRYKHLEKIGVNCELISEKCPCEHNHEDCQCGLGGKCLGSKCQSEECSRINAWECDCPTSLRVESCNICCMNNSEGPCLSSKNLTQLKLAMGSTTIKDLGKFNTLRILPNLTEFKNFCHGNECVTLAFKISKVGDYCLHGTKLGICTSSGCHVERRKPFGVEMMTRSCHFKSTTWSIFYNIFIIWCLVTDTY